MQGFTGITGINPPYSAANVTCAGFTGPGTCIASETFSPTASGTFTGVVDADECPLTSGPCIPIAVSLTGNGV